RHGARVLVVDKAAYGSDTTSTHALMRGGVLQLARWGLLDAVREAGAAPITTTSFHYGSEELALALKPRGDVDALYAPRRHVLDRILVDAASAAGAEVVHGVSFEDVLRDAQGSVVGARLRGAGQAAVEVRAR